MSADLASLLAPLEPATFFSEYWNRRALYLPGTPAKFADLFSRAAFDAEARTCGVLKVNYTDERGWPSEREVRPEEIPQLLAAGKTVCAGNIGRDNPALSAFLARFQAQFEIAGGFHFNAYLSPAGGGFGLHFDNHPVWILQIEGQKRWRISGEPALPRVVTNVSFPEGRTTLNLPWGTVERPSEESLREVVLSPGDILYLPKGAWHQASAIGGSLGLTLAQSGAAPIEILQYALMPLLGGVEFRDMLPAFWEKAPYRLVNAELEPRFEELLAAFRSAAASLTVNQLIGLWRQAGREARASRGGQK